MRADGLVCSPAFRRSSALSLASRPPKGGTTNSCVPHSRVGSLVFGCGAIECLSDGTGLRHRATRGLTVGAATRFRVCTDRLGMAQPRFGPTQYGRADAFRLAVLWRWMAKLRNANRFRLAAPGLGAARGDARPTTARGAREGGYPCRLRRSNALEPVCRAGLAGKDHGRDTRENSDSNTESHQNIPCVRTCLVSEPYRRASAESLKSKQVARRKLPRPPSLSMITVMSGFSEF